MVLLGTRPSAGAPPAEDCDRTATRVRMFRVCVDQADACLQSRLATRRTQQRSRTDVRRQLDAERESRRVIWSSDRHSGQLSRCSEVQSTNHHTTCHRRRQTWSNRQIEYTFRYVDRALHEEPARGFNDRTSACITGIRPRSDATTRGAQCRCGVAELQLYGVDVLGVVLRGQPRRQRHTDAAQSPGVHGLSQRTRPRGVKRHSLRPIRRRTGTAGHRRSDRRTGPTSTDRSSRSTVAGSLCRWVIFKAADSSTEPAGIAPPWL